MIYVFVILSLRVFPILHSETEKCYYQQQTIIHRVKLEGCVMNHQDYFTKHDEYQDYAAGTTIFKEGDPGNGKMYAVKSGEVEITYNGVVLETVKPGSFFGEMSLVDSSPRAATATARVDSQIVEVGKYHFLFLTQETPMFALQVMHVMAERIRKLHTMV